MYGLAQGEKGIDDHVGAVISLSLVKDQIDAARVDVIVNYTGRYVRRNDDDRPEAQFRLIDRRQELEPGPFSLMQFQIKDNSLRQIVLNQIDPFKTGAGHADKRDIVPFAGAVLKFDAFCDIILNKQQ